MKVVERYADRDGDIGELESRAGEAPVACRKSRAIVWLSLLGIRKRKMTSGRWSLKGWTSAHVYLGLSLIVIGTLHTGFQLGWNVHTLAWSLMMIVIISGIVGIYFYATLPDNLSNNRADGDGAVTERMMIEQLRSLDRQLHDAAQPLDPAQAGLVQASLEQDPFAGNFFQRIGNSYSGCETRAAMAELRRMRAYQPRMGDDPLDKVDGLLQRKESKPGCIPANYSLNNQKASY